jgi:hypothetical protein
MKRKQILIPLMLLFTLVTAMMAVPHSFDWEFQAEPAIREQILNRFPDPSVKEENYFDSFTRTRIPRQRPKSIYTVAMVEHAPEGKVASASCFPFEIYDQPAYAKAPPAVLLFGYCEIVTAPEKNTTPGMTSILITPTVYVYSVADMKYVVAAEHPFIKARAAVAQK